MALSETEELEMLELEKAQHEDRIKTLKIEGNRNPGAPFVPSGEKHIPDLLTAYSGTGGIRMAMNAAEPVLGAAQLMEKGQSYLADKMGVKYPNVVDAHLKQLEKTRQEGQDFIREHDPSGDVTGRILGATGAVGSPDKLAMAKALKSSGSLIKDIGKGSAFGAAVGATDPVTSADNNFWEHKGTQIGLGTVVGGAGAPVARTINAAGRMLRDIGDLGLPGGAERMGDRALNKIVGDKHKTEVVTALNNPANPVLNTAAQSLAQTPGGSPIVALQKRIAASDGGISADFTELANAQVANRRNKMLAQTSGNNTAQTNVAEALHDALFQAESRVGGGGNTIRRETPEAFLKAIKDPNAAAQMRPDQAAAYNDIAGELNTNWHVAHPVQRTTLPSQANTAPQIPHMLSTPATVVNFVLRQMGANIEPAVQKAMAERLKNPHQLADVLSKLPPKAQQIVDALMKQAQPAASLGAAKQEGAQ